MDSIEYRGMLMDVLKSTWERESMYDPSGTTYECTRVRGNATVTYNPQAASFTTTPPFPEIRRAPTATPGQMPADTDVAIRSFLEQPRGLLRVRTNGMVWLESPLLPNDLGSPRFQRSAISQLAGRDTRNGPFVKVNNVEQIQGERLWRIHLEIETFINETPLPRNSNINTIVPILSNRWYASDDTNWQHLRTRTYQGVCTVRPDVLAMRLPISQEFVDYFRNQFASFTVPLGFQRELVKVTATPDGLSAHYTVVDTEQLWNKSQGCPAVRIEVGDTDWYWTGSKNRALMMMGGISGMIMDVAAIGALGAAGVAGWAAPGSGAALGAAILFARSAADRYGNAYLGNLPKASKSVTVRCWGNQRTARGDLVRYACAVCTTRLFAVAPLNDTVGTSEIIVKQDSSNFVEVTQTTTFGLDIALGALGAPVAAVVAFGNAVDPNADPGAAPFLQRFHNSLGASPNTNTFGFNHTQMNLLVNPRFPADSGTRGTASMNAAGTATGALQILLTQILESFDQVPAAVP